MSAIRLVLVALVATLAFVAPASALDIRMGVLRIDYPRLLPISRYDERPDDLGFAGGKLGEEDNQTTGAFLGMNFTVDYTATPPEGADAALQAFLEDGVALLVVVAEGPDVLRLADAAGEGALVLNASARDVSLRDDACRANLLHTGPSHAMIADAVTQFAIWKKWPDWFLIEGSNPKDTALAEAYRRSAKKFGAKIVESRVFEDTGGSRRTDTGHVLVQRQIPVFTQGAKDHDVIIGADESDVFALHLPYHTWEPRPVMGSGGLRPVTFHAAHEAWGATQFQRRFEELTGRYVQEKDYDVWLAIRAIGEAVIRTNTADPVALRDYMLTDQFELAAFKGRAVSFRPWNGQLRQPIIMTDDKTTVTVSPQEGYLHQVTTLDTLGLDQPESACTAFTE
ncbi:ABC transporter substrate-binding protein [Algicella marina]|uniref:ABC transporter substrate-binding protein n=1 Tax=Algicella marina TaxID=2683284 RepID=A0A6P1T7E2_9RHOB|nr:ABC transporter substrate-binding protein [Algicella marina]QHQ36492.1 ABC transporter substrate-binding protein [Algicella marina]